MMVQHAYVRAQHDGYLNIFVIVDTNNLGIYLRYFRLFHNGRSDNFRFEFKRLHRLSIIIVGG